MVVEVLLAADELLAVARRQEEAAALLVAEQRDGKNRAPARLLEPLQLSCRNVQLVETVRHVCVVLEHACVLRLAGAPAAEEPPIRGRELTEEELCESASSFEIVTSFEATARLRQRGQRKSVPRSDRLVVAEWLRPQLALREEPCTGLGIELAANDEATMLERLQELARNVVCFGPRVRQSLDAVRVGVLCRREAAFGQPQLAQHVVEGLFRYLPVAF